MAAPVQRRSLMGEGLLLLLIAFSTIVVSGRTVAELRESLAARRGIRKAA